MELKDIKAIIDLMKKNDLSVFEMEKDGFRLKLQKGAGEQIVFATPPLSPVAASRPRPLRPLAAEAPRRRRDKARAKEIISPMVGTFYRAGSPEWPPSSTSGRR